MTKLVSHWLPQPRIPHPWPNQRFAVKYPRWKPYAGKPHVRLCAGCALKQIRGRDTYLPELLQSVCCPSIPPQIRDCEGLS
jgi:hypothetical protein